jgi:hypothetical protein
LLFLLSTPPPHYQELRKACTHWQKQYEVAVEKLVDKRYQLSKSKAALAPSSDVINTTQNALRSQSQQFSNFQKEIRQLELDVAASRRNFELSRFDCIWKYNQIEAKKRLRLLSCVNSYLMGYHHLARDLEKILREANVEASVKKAEVSLSQSRKTFMDEQRLWSEQRKMLEQNLAASHPFKQTATLAPDPKLREHFRALHANADFFDGYKGRVSMERLSEDDVAPPPADLGGRTSMERLSDEEAASTSSLKGVVQVGIEGFVCPECLQQLSSAEHLKTHHEMFHNECGHPQHAGAARDLLHDLLPEHAQDVSAASGLPVMDFDSSGTATCRVLSACAEERRQIHLRMSPQEVDGGSATIATTSVPTIFKEGWLWVKLRFGWRRQWFRLLQQGEDGVFQEYGSSSSSSNALLGASNIKVNVLLCTVRQLATASDSSKTTSLNNGGFELISPQSSPVLLQGDNPQQTAAWVDAIRDSIKHILASQRQELPAQVAGWDSNGVPFGQHGAAGGGEEETGGKGGNASSGSGGSGNFPSGSARSIERGSDLLERLQKNAVAVRCVECGAAKPEWVSLNLGLLLCIECSGTHRSLGTHISKVRSLSLDSFGPRVLGLVEYINQKWETDEYIRKTRAIWEARVRSEKPQPHSSHAEKGAYIKSKYTPWGGSLPRVDSAASSSEELAALFNDALSKGNVGALLYCIVMGFPLNDDVRFEGGNTVDKAEEMGHPLCAELLLQNGAHHEKKEDKIHAALLAAPHSPSPFPAEPHEQPPTSSLPSTPEVTAASKGRFVSPPSEGSDLTSPPPAVLVSKETGSSSLVVPPPPATALSPAESAPSLKTMQERSIPDVLSRIRKERDPNALFVIQKSTNNNSVIYSAKNAPGGALLDIPVEGYWIMFEQQGQPREELNMVERNTAYGLTSTWISQGRMCNVTLSALKSKVIVVTSSKHRDNEDTKLASAKTTISGVMARLRRVFVQLESNWMGIPTVQYVDVFGMTEDGQIVKERIVPE